MNAEKSEKEMIKRNENWSNETRLTFKRSRATICGGGKRTFIYSREESLIPTSCSAQSQSRVCYAAPARFRLQFTRNALKSHLHFAPFSA